MDGKNHTSEGEKKNKIIAHFHVLMKLLYCDITNMRVILQYTR